jgi:3-oxoacyl-[acyl-carrier-protein] synthase II
LTQRRVVVTGLGLISPVGIGTEETWQAICAGQSGIGPITLFDASRISSRIAGEVKNFDPLRWLDKKEVRKMARFIHFAVGAAHMAVGHAALELDAVDATRVGVDIGSSIGGFDVVEREHRTLLEKGADRLSPFLMPSMLANLAAGYVSIHLGAKGPNAAPVTACATGAHAVGDAFRMVARGEADVMVAGGTEASLTPLIVGGFAAMRALSTSNDDADHASRPWDKRRDGFIIAEGAAVLVLEAEDFARARGAKPLAEIVGYGMSADSHHIAQPPEDGDGVFRVMQNALADAGLTPADVQYVNAHATSTPLGDRAEARAIMRLFGEHTARLRVSSTKSMTGHLLGAAGALEAAFTVLALRDQIVPPTINLEQPDEDLALDFTPGEARQASLDCAMSNSFGFGGTNASLIFRRL